MTHIVYSLFSLLILIGCISGTPKKEGLIPLKPLMHLPAELDESSGMIAIGEDLYVGNNDSGNPAEVYVFSIKQKSATRMVSILNAENEDWEELSADEQYIYIGDTGNNSGKRNKLTIYRILKEQIITKNEATAEAITFYYPERKNEKPSKEHNFDCEAFVCVGDSLYLFTKNRGNSKTDLYSIPKVPGHYAANHLGMFDAEGLVTGADFRSSGVFNELVLIGYQVESKGYHPFLLYFSKVIGTRFFESPVKRYTFNGTMQTETILFHDEEHVYISNEEEHGDQGLIYQVDIKN